MIPPNDMKQRSEQIYVLLANGKIDYAIKRLMDFATEFDGHEARQEAVVISCNFVQLEKDQRRGRVGWEEAAKHRNNLLYQAMGLVEAIQQELMHVA
jgi:hypothetical protein